MKKKPRRKNDGEIITLEREIWRWGEGEEKILGTYFNGREVYENGLQDSKD
jgi:hypothetical protein